MLYLLLSEFVAGVVRPFGAAPLSFFAGPREGSRRERHEKWHVKWDKVGTCRCLSRKSMHYRTKIIFRPPRDRFNT